MNNPTKGFLSTVLVFVIVVGIPAAVVGINDQLIGTEAPTVRADNLLFANIFQIFHVPFTLSRGILLKGRV